MGKKASRGRSEGPRGRKATDRRPGGKPKPAAKGTTRVSKDGTGKPKGHPPRGGRSGGTSGGRPGSRPARARAAGDLAARRGEEGGEPSEEERPRVERSREPAPVPAKAAEKEREAHWIDFATKEQKDVVHEELNMFGDSDDPWEALVVRGDNNVFHYQKGSFTSIHLMPREAKDRFKGLMGNPGLKHFGLFLGMFKGNQFNLSIEGAAELARQGAATRNYVKLSDDGEKSFLYGQDIKKDALQEVCPRGITHDRGICIVLNARGECIGIGKLEAQDPKLVKISEDEIAIKNVVDRGVYLRDQDRYA